MENKVMVKDKMDLGVIDAPINVEVTVEARKYIDDLKKDFDINDRSKVVAFGQVEQSKLGVLTDQMLEQTKTKELSEAGAILVEVITDLEAYNKEVSSEWRIVNWFRTVLSKMNKVKLDYQSLSTNMDKIISKLQEKNEQLEGLTIEMDGLLKQNQHVYQALTLAVIAAEEIKKEQELKLNDEVAKAEASNDMRRIQELSIMKDNYLRWDRRIYNLRLSRAIALSQLPQIRNIQKSAESISENINSTIINTIPIWKAQMVIALGMQEVDEAAAADQLVRDATNRMLVMNSERNKRLTIGAAKAMEKGAIDLETISKINKNTIATIKECHEIVENGIKERKQAAIQLEKEEMELRNAVANYAKGYVFNKEKKAS